MVPFAGYSMPLVYGDIGQGGFSQYLFFFFLFSSLNNVQLKVITTSEKV